MSTTALIVLGVATFIFGLVARKKTVEKAMTIFKLIFFGFLGICFGVCTLYYLVATPIWIIRDRDGELGLGGAICFSLCLGITILCVRGIRRIARDERRRQEVKLQEMVVTIDGVSYPVRYPVHPTQGRGREMEYLPMTIAVGDYTYDGTSLRPRIVKEDGVD